MRNVGTLLIACLLVGACTEGGARDIALEARVEVAPPAGPEFGLYQIYWGRRYREIVERDVAKFARKPDYIMFYRDLGRPFPKYGIDIIREQGATPIIALELWHWMRHRRGESRLPALAAGEYDEWLRKWAKDAKADGRRVLLRFGFEMNGDWFTWSGNPEQFQEVWRRARAIFAEEGADNVEWVWCPNILSVPKTKENGMHHYYPGDEHVDWVALDGYNFGEHHDEWHVWESFEDVFGKVLDEFAERYPEKPLMVAETGCAPGSGNQRAEWYEAAWAYLKTRPEVRAVVWFNLDKRREGEPNWRIDLTKESLDAFNRTFATPRRSPPERD